MDGETDGETQRQREIDWIGLGQIRTEQNRVDREREREQKKEGDREMERDGETER